MAFMGDNAERKLAKFAVGDRVLVPSAQRVTTITEIVRQGDTLGYRLAGLGQAVIAEEDMERISIDGTQKASVLTPRHD
jgi:hypothetical protein